jgi:beta-lactam-binding protein with PASTA domain
VRKFFRFVMMAMILVMVGVMSALTAMRIAIHGRETTVPNFAKLSVAEAERAAVAQGLQTAIEGQFYNTEIPEGRIVSQTPPPGTRVRRGWRVRLAQSLGPQRTVIPDIVGQSPRAAELNVRQRGLELGTVAEATLPDEPAQQIVAQSPPPNASGVQSPKVSVLVATQEEPPSFVMPNFVGRTLSEAESRIADAGFKVQVNSFSQPSSTPGAKPSLVIRQVPVAGQRVNSQTVIQLEVTR